MVMSHGHATVIAIWGFRIDEARTHVIKIWSAPLLAQACTLYPDAHCQLVAQEHGRVRLLSLECCETLSVHALCTGMNAGQALHERTEWIFALGEG